MQVQLRNRDWGFFAPVPKKNLFDACSPPPKPGLGRETASCSTKNRQERDCIFPSISHCGPPRTLSWAPQNICRLWKLLKTHRPPAPSVSPAGCARSIISARLVAAAAV